MTLMELKTCITNKSVPTEFLILVAKDNSFLAKQYIQAIDKLVPGGITKINSIYEPQQSSLILLTSTTNTVNVLYTDTFDERAENYSQFENTIVICNQIDKSIASAVKDYAINLPKLEDWQIYDYIKTLCPALPEEDILWLIKATESNIERILAELDKVALFEGEQQRAIFSAIRFDPQLDLYKIDLFTVVNALVEGNSLALFNFLKYNDYEALEPVMLANRTLASLKNIILISQNPMLTAEECGVSAGQHRFIRSKYSSLNTEAVRQKIKFLTNFDLALKTSHLDMSKRDMLNYLINNLNYKITP